MSGSCEPVPGAFPVLRAEGLLLRQMEEADAPVLFANNTDPDVVYAMGGGPMTAIEEAVAAIESIRNRFREKTMLRWAIVPEELGTSVGSTGFNEFDERDRRASLGYGLAKAWWGRGIMTAASRVCIEYAFTELDLNRIEATVIADNSRSLRVLEKLGFQREGLLRQHHRVRDEMRDEWMVSLLRRDWEHQR